MVIKIKVIKRWFDNKNKNEILFCIVLTYSYLCIDFL